MQFKLTANVSQLLNIKILLCTVNMLYTIHWNKLIFIIAYSAIKTCKNPRPLRLLFSLFIDLFNLLFDSICYLVKDALFDPAINHTANIAQRNSQYRSA